VFGEFVSIKAEGSAAGSGEDGTVVKLKGLVSQRLSI